MNLSEINWDFNASGSWPVVVKAGFIAIVCVALSGAWIYLDTLNQITELEDFQKKENDLKEEFERKQNKANNLHDYELQLTQIEAQLYEMIQQMPTKEEVASLLVDISQMGLSNGLEFKLFKPSISIGKDFYSELPISIQVVGKYDQLGLFISGLASLPRIVTIHDINLIPYKSDNAPDRLLMNAVIKTYNENSENTSIGKTSDKKRKVGTVK